jgi:hypothetical protein
MDLVTTLNSLPSNNLLWFNAVPLAKAHGVSLGVDTLGFDDSGKILVVTGSESLDTPFSGESISWRKAKKSGCAAIWSSAFQQWYTPQDYINKMTEIS